MPSRYRLVQVDLFYGPGVAEPVVELGGAHGPQGQVHAGVEQHVMNRRWVGKEQVE